MEDAKQRSRRDAEDRRSDRDRGREREKEHHRRAAEKERERDRDRERERERERDRGGASEKHVSSSSRHRDKEKESARNSRHREDHKPSRDAEREKQRSKTKDKDRDDRYNKADRDRDRERDHERERDRERDRERKRRHIRDSDSEDDFERKRRKREDSRTSVRDRYKDEDSRSPARERDRVRERERHRDDGDTDREIERNLGADDEDEGRRASASVSAKRKSDESENEEEKEAREKKKKEDMEEEQRKLFEHIEKRRRRVQEWQEMRRLKEESDKVQPSEQAQVGRKWTLEGDDSDDDVDEANAKANGDAKSNAEGVLAAADDAQDKKTHNGGDPMTVDGESSNAAAAADEEEIDPLDAFMNTLVVPDMDDSQKPPQSDNSNSKDTKPASRIGFNKPSKNGLGRIIPGEGSDDENEVVDEDEENIEDEDDDEFMRRVKKSKVEKLSIVDHSKVQYMAFRKDFYREVKEIALMTPDDVAQYRKQLELKIRGKDVPKPIKTWNQTGLTRNVLEIIKKLGFEKPMSIQAQALPAIMSGRDCIGVAKTGSGKTLAFVLPMLRHIKDQPPLGPGDGPIGLVMAPTRELVQQIHSDIKKFTKVLGLNCVPVYGGSGVAQQISELKRGTEVVVCTPGRMIDILCTSGGKITNLKRVTYLVMDEADRMFDMGFEPQITRIVQNTRPDRQTVLFSATFPRQVETLARKVLNKPVEIQVGGRSVVNKDITQTIEVRLEGERFLRLLEILGEWYEKGKILVFVHTQDKCDNLFKDLLRHGYPCLSLHGAKDQTDRESTISDFKSNVCNLLIATSVAARGLDVKELELVVNYDAPNHYEDYVHRVGRTGRAGRKGFAITFISQEEERYAPDLVKALELSEQPIPQDLKTLADGFMAKVSQGTEHAHGTGYGGSGFKFNEEEEEARKAAKKAQAREYGYEEYDKSDSEDEDEGIRKAGGDIAHAAALVQAAALAAATKSTIPSLPLSSNTAAVANPATTGLPVESWVSGVQTVPGLAGSLPMAGLPGTFSVPNDAAARAAAFAAALNLQHNLAKIQKDAMPEHYEAELEINDFPQNARWKVTHKETLGPISEWTGAAITTRGQYYPPGKIPGPGERKLYLFIEGPTESSVKKAKAEVKRVLEDYTAQAISLSGSVQPGKYSVL